MSTVTNDPPTLAITSTTAIANTGSTHHFCTIDARVINKRRTSNPINIRNPNGSIMRSTHEAELDLPHLPPTARHVHIVPELQSLSLISMGQLCDSGCSITFDADTVRVTYDNVIVLSGTRTTKTKLWHLDLSSTPQYAPKIIHQANGAIGSATPAELIAFAHATLFSPTLSTLHSALAQGFLTNFPGLNTRTLRKYPPQSIAMIKGHLDQSRKNQRSTKSTTSTTTANEHETCFPTSNNPNTRTHSCYATIMEPTGQIYSDQTGRFVVPSSNGNNYLMILYDYDSNAILAEPMRTRTGKSILTAFETLQKRLITAGLTPQLHRLDNECSDALKAHLRDSSIEFQLVPPGVHRRNAAERAIRTFKNHFIAGLCSVDKDFPLHLWDRLVPQAELSLNLMRGSRLNPKLSAHAQMHGQFDYNRTPLAPPGIRVLLHEKPDKRTTWSTHALDGWYVGPALDSYRCYNIWVWETRSCRIVDTISWFPTKVTMPLASSTDLILAGIHDIITALNNPSPGSPLAPLSDSHVAALRQVTAILTNIAQPAEASHPDPAPAANPALVATPLVQPATSLRVATTARKPLRPTLRVKNGLTTCKTVQFGPLPSPHSSNTFANSTGPIGTKRRRNKRKTSQRLPVPTKTVHPILHIRRQQSTQKRNPHAPTKPKKTHNSRPVHKPHHTHGTRANTNPLQHVAATASALFNPILPDPPAFMHHALHGNAFNPDTGKLAEYLELSNWSEGTLWQQSNAEEIGRLAQGHGTTKGTNTIVFIHPSQIPQGRKVTYLRVVSAFRPEKTNPRRVRWTVGGDRVEYPGDVSTKTADLCTAKLLFNSVVSTPTAKFMTCDLKDFYLGTPMERYEYMRVPIHMIPDEIMEAYNLTPLIKNGFVYVEIQRGVYGLPQAGKIANDQLIQFLKPHGYAPVPLTPGLWKHKTRNLVFSLVVDDFGVKYVDRSEAEHLLTTLEIFYKVSTDWSGTRYIGLTLAWDYEKRTCDVSMPGYVERAIQRFQHPTPVKREDSPHAWQKPNYGNCCYGTGSCLLLRDRLPIRTYQHTIGI
jgi:hypothetical protein